MLALPKEPQLTEESWDRRAGCFPHTNGSVLKRYRQVTLFELSRFYLRICAYIQIYMAPITTDEKRGHEFKGEHGRLCGWFYREESIVA